MKKHIERLEKLLPFVDKPSRYIGGEIGEIRKEYREGMLRFALAFPEVYEIGTSHHGGEILYQIVNAHERLICERVFCPWRDMAELLRENEIPLLSIESGTPLANFDVVGFSLEYELSYTNVLEMFDLAGIPLKWRDRGEEHPIIIAGGPSVFNPEPVAEFFDLFVIGDGEESLPTLLENILDSKLPREELLRELANLEGVYVPRFYTPTFCDGFQDGFITETDMPKTVKSIQLERLPDRNYLTQPIIPWVESVHDRLSIEIMRGCGQGCRFCPAGWIYRPVRERDCATVFDEAQTLAQSGGWEEIGFLSLSSTDYSALANLLAKSGDLAEKNTISISLPSLRPEGLDAPAISVLAKTRKTSMTFAPEAGTERLRAVINKTYDEEALLQTIERVYSAGWRTTKLYFMVGLPTETDDDIRGIAKLCEKVWAIAKRRRGNLNVSISPFVPKGHTPFAWERQASAEEIDAKYRILRAEMPKGIKLHARDPRLARIEVALSRGDRRLGDALIDIWRSGGGFDAWKESFEPKIWEHTFSEHGIPLENFAREHDPQFVSPWEIVSKPISREVLLAERKKALDEKPSPSCYERGGCDNCGVCGYTANEVQKQPPQPQRGNYGRRTKKISKPGVLANNKIRLRLSRENHLRWLGHLDITRAIARAIRRSGLNVAYSEGHHRHQKVSFGPPLPVGYVSKAEYLDIEFETQITSSEIEAFGQELPHGINLMDFKPMLKRSSSIFSSMDSALFSVDILKEIAPNLPNAFEELVSRDSIPFARFKKTVELKSYLKFYEIKNYGDRWHLRIMLQCDPNGSGRPSEYLLAVGIPEVEVLGLPYLREELLIQSGEEFFDPFGARWGTWGENISTEVK
jgi:radical SAM family uncharacterized protein/radical SAM-linked protein